MASASSAPTVNLTILQWLLQWESMHMVSLRLVHLHLLQLMYLWHDAFWDPHPVLDIRPRRLFSLDLLWCIKSTALPQALWMFLLTSRRDQSSVNWVTTGDVQPLFLLIQIFGNNSWNRINFRCRNTSALFDTAAPMVPNSWWGRKIPWRTWSLQVYHCVNLFGTCIQLVFSAYLGISFICECWFSELNRVSVLYILRLEPQNRCQSLKRYTVGGRWNPRMSRLSHYYFEKIVTISLHICFWGEMHPSTQVQQLKLMRTR